MSADSAAIAQNGSALEASACTFLKQLNAYLTSSFLFYKNNCLRVEIRSYESFLTFLEFREMIGWNEFEVYRDNKTDTLHTDYVYP